MTVSYIHQGEEVFVAKAPDVYSWVTVVAKVSDFLGYMCRGELERKVTISVSTCIVKDCFFVGDELTITLEKPPKVK